ncbi:hypothetical protein DACRYDRAFT_101721 [Dacryopinax primogenitus]|uniref:F-box domain-containing protein n=1 Tax=Dacryopinax primogenitus (strain DJM 731) TaxID=1858805 RepID=M5FPL4_DACPD|nr:uncharacterized protein DACRYDRAFT_101721 [Dacryopinax primogenitus]EJT98645.1 hypothetical protein DACRYDRAFT_101721 [Dacryopinax primogenitus]
MHRALQIPEILQLIFSHLAHDDLAILLRTSGFFFFPSASQLWASVDTEALMCLVNLFLDTEEVKNPTATSKRHYSIASRMRRFQMYAPLIQTLDLDLTSGVDEEGESEELNDDYAHLSLTAIATLTRTSALLPGLRSLHYTTLEAEHLNNVLLFLAPSLEELYVKTFHCDDQYWGNAEADWALPVGCLLEALPRLCPRLRKLSLAAHMPRTSIHLSTVISLVTKLAFLECFECDFIGLHPTLLGALARRPALQELRVGYYNVDILGEQVAYQLVCHPPFPALRSLHLSANQHIAPMFLKLIPPQLHSLTLDIGAEPFTPEALAYIASMVAAGQPHLRALSLTCRDFDYGADTSVDFDVFAPLLQIKSITQLELSYLAATRLALADTHVAAIGNAWPALEVLNLQWNDRLATGSGGLADESALTLSALAVLTTRCRRLERVELRALNIYHIPPPPPIAPVQAHVELRLTHGRVHVQPELLAAFLYTLWPRIQMTGPFISLPHAPAQVTADAVPLPPGTTDTDRDREKWITIRGMIASMRCQQIMEARKGATPERVRESFEPKYRDHLLSPATI